MTVAWWEKCKGNKFSDCAALRCKCKFPACKGNYDLRNQPTDRQTDQPNIHPTNRRTWGSYGIETSNNNIIMCSKLLLSIVVFFANICAIKVRSLSACFWQNWARCHIRLAAKHPQVYGENQWSRSRASFIQMEQVKNTHEDVKNHATHDMTRRTFAEEGRGGKGLVWKLEVEI